MVIVLINVWVKTPCLFQGDRLSSGQLKANRHCILQLLTRSYSKYSALFRKCCSKKNLKKKKIFKGLFSKVLINSELAFMMCNKKKIMLICLFGDWPTWRQTYLYWGQTLKIIVGLTQPKRWRNGELALFACDWLRLG